MRPILVVLIAAHNEEHCIASTLRSLTRQHRPPDRIVVAADNCTDGTVDLARSVPGVTVFETEGNTAKKPGALNQAWRRYAADPLTSSMGRAASATSRPNSWNASDGSGASTSSHAPASCIARAAKASAA